MAALDQLLVVIDPVARRTDGESVRIARDVLGAGAVARVCLPDGAEEFDRALGKGGSRRLVLVGDDRALVRAVTVLHRRRELAGRALSVVPVGPVTALARYLGVPTGAVAASRAVLDGTPRRLDLLVDDSDGVVVGTLRIPPLGGPGGDGVGGLVGGGAARYGEGGSGSREYGGGGYGTGGFGAGEYAADGIGIGNGTRAGAGGRGGGGEGAGGGRGRGSSGGVWRAGREHEEDPEGRGEGEHGDDGEHGGDSGARARLLWLRSCRSFVRTLGGARPGRLPGLPGLTDLPGVLLGGPNGRSLGRSHRRSFGEGGHGGPGGHARLRVEADGVTLIDLDQPVRTLSLSPGSAGRAELEVRPLSVGADAAPVLASARTVTVSGEDFRYRADAVVGGPVRTRTWTVREGAWSLTLPG